MLLRTARYDDLPAILKLFRSTVMHVNSRDYTPEQIDAWCDGAEHTGRWTNRIAQQYFLVAEKQGALAGFGSLSPDGCIDLLYVHHAMQGKSVGKTLLDGLETKAAEWQCPVVHAHVSITALPFFERCGYVTVQWRERNVGGVVLRNILMEKHVDN